MIGVDDRSEMRQAKLKVLEYVYRHEGKSKDTGRLASILCPEVDYSSIERHLVEEHLLVENGEIWRLTPLGRLYTEIFQASKQKKWYLIICLIFCLGVLAFLVLRFIV